MTRTTTARQSAADGELAPEQSGEVQIRRNDGIFACSVDASTMATAISFNTNSGAASRRSPIAYDH